MEYLFLKPNLLVMALLSGLTFGFLLQKATVSQFDVIVGQLLLKNFTVMKVILSAIVTGSVGIYTLDALALIPTFHLSGTPILFSIIGGSVFGIGMSLTGYCPGTALIALATGAKDMIFGLLGMFVGTIVFNEISPILLPLIGRKDVAFQQTISSFFLFLIGL